MPPISPTHLNELMKQYGPALQLYARQWCHHADDVVQEAFIELLKRDILPDSPKAWLYQVVRSRALNQNRSDARRRRHESVAAHDDVSAHESEPWFSEAADPPFDRQELTRALQQLSPEHRETLIARIWGKLSFAEIGDLMNVSASSAHRRFSSAVSELRMLLADAETPSTSQN